MSFTETLQSLTGKLLADCTDQELYLALLELVRQKSADRVQPVTGRKLYYISAEFLIGKLLSNNLINLGLYDEARSALAAAGKRLSDIEEVEPEPSLGNGGLGRLAACFLDSLATLNLPGDGVGLRYHFGLFRQSFEDGVQNEKPDPWLTAHSWAEKTDTTYPVELAGKEYTARLYKLAVTGYEGRTNTLNLFDLDTIDESIVHDGIAFDKTAIDKNLTLFLYPDDSDEAGRRLRVYQQYLMVSAGAQLILAECAARGCNFHDLADYAAILQVLTDAGVDTTDVLSALTAHSSENIYYRTDHHWTSLGAYYAYCAWRDIEPAAGEWTQEILCGNFRGTTWNKVPLPTVPAEEITAWYQHPTRHVSYNNGQYETESIYERKYLSGSDQYAVFLNSNQAQTVIEGSGKNGKLLLIKDSYGNTFSQFPVEDYAEVHVLDLRFFKGDVAEL